MFNVLSAKYTNVGDSCASVDLYNGLSISAVSPPDDGSNEFYCHKRNFNIAFTTFCADLLQSHLCLFLKKKSYRVIEITGAAIFLSV